MPSPPSARTPNPALRRVWCTSPRVSGFGSRMTSEALTLMNHCPPEVDAGAAVLLPDEVGALVGAGAGPLAAPASALVKVVTVFGSAGTGAVVWSPALCSA